MKCLKCNTQNDDDARFCVKCGAVLEKPKTPKKQLMTKRQIILTIIAVIAIIAVGASIHYSNILMGEPTLVGHDFDGIFTMDVPEGSNFVLKDLRTQNALFGYAGYINKGDYGYRIAIVMITPSNNDISSGDVIEDDGTMKVTKNMTDNENPYNLYIKKDNCQIMMSGWDLDLMKRMAETIEIKNLDSLQVQTTQVPHVN
ncbi:MAG: zinc ribbon domain-containing protein [Methanobrevibacter sp.]|nr:zinc ribbon domain-containing protein [Methanobrevibacter sp.]